MNFQIIRKIDQLGRLCIPIDCRRHLGISEKTNDSILITITEDGILLQKAKEEDKQSLNES